MPTAQEFADQISAIHQGRPVTESIVPVTEEIADWRGPLQDVQVRLRQMIQKDVDKFMESANAILAAAERSDWSKQVITSEVKRWKGDVDRLYARFAQSTKGFMDLVKAMGVTTRRHSGKGKPLKRQGKKDWGKLGQVQLKKEIRDQVKRLSAGIHRFADDGAFMLRQIDRILKYKKPKDETVREEIGALFQDFADFKAAFGNKVMAPYYGLIGRLNAVRPQPLGQYSKAFRSSMRKRPLKTMPATPVVPGSMVAHAALPYDCPELREALERDKMRGSNALLAEGSEADALVSFVAEEIGLAEGVEPEAQEESTDLWEFVPDFNMVLYGESDDTDGDDRPFDLDEAGGAPSGSGKLAIKQIFGFLRLRGAIAKGGRWVHGTAKIPGGSLSLDADDSRVTWTVYSHGTVLDTSSSPYRKSIQSVVRPIQSAMELAAAKQEDIDGGGEPLEEMTQVQTTIYQQFGGGRSMAMLGGQVHDVDSNTLGIRWPNKKRSKGNYVEIKYIPGKDLYDVEFFNVSIRAKKSVKKYRGIYADQLREIFEKQTGWYLRM